MSLAPWRCPHASRALAMPACLSRPGDARMPLAPWRCPHASRPGDARMPRALAMASQRKDGIELKDRLKVEKDKRDKEA
ncbi:hypothetical protein VNO80_25295 [Phaseolus coccineus]|uniref:Uncharacterized protein n=1 Tax=Phaseolus coccineus TaxID=3886 RepID=A0AAN9LUK0_PHACN